MEQQWKPINEILWECPYRFPSGIARSLLLRLSETKFLVYSPGDKATAELARQIVPEHSEIFLLAPNSYHNLGVSDWASEFPESAFVAAQPAIDRLEKKTKIKPAGLDSLKAALPNHISLLELPHNKVGEVWLDIKMPSERIWAVCDAIFNFSRLPSGLMGMLMRLNRMGPGIEMSRVYQYLGTSNKREYGAWLLSELDHRNPTTLVPMHGEIHRAPDLIETLKQFTEIRLIS